MPKEIRPDEYIIDFGELRKLGFKKITIYLNEGKAVVRRKGQVEGFKGSVEKIKDLKVGLG